MSKAMKLRQKNFAKMTLQELKDNRNEIIALISEQYGASNLKEIMSVMVEEVESRDDIDNLIYYAAYQLDLTPSRRKTSKSAESHGSWMESKGYTRFDHSTKQYV